MQVEIISAGEDKDLKEAINAWMKNNILDSDQLFQILQSESSVMGSGGLKRRVTVSIWYKEKGEE